MSTAKSNNIYKYLVVVMAIVIVGLLFVKFNNSGQISQKSNSNPVSNVTTQTSTLQSTMLSTTTILNNTLANNTNQQNTTPKNKTVVQALYSQKKQVHIAAPSYNQYYNYVIGCYWISGYYNFSFYAPYPGYVVFNETNTGIPTNKSIDYLAVYFSTQKPYYYEPQPYNNTSFCPGEIVVSNVEPWTQVTPFNNQTMIIPVKNGTNYVIFDNGNANQQHGVNPFSINVTFSMTYHGFKGTAIPAPPNTTTYPSNVIPWGKYQGG